MGEAEARRGPAAQSGRESEAGKMPSNPQETEVATAEYGRRREGPSGGIWGCGQIRGGIKGEYQGAICM